MKKNIFYIVSLSLVISIFSCSKGDIETISDEGSSTDMVSINLSIPETTVVSTRSITNNVEETIDNLYLLDFASDGTFKKGVVPNHLTVNQPSTNNGTITFSIAYFHPLDGDKVIAIVNPRVKDALGNTIDYSTTAFPNIHTINDVNNYFDIDYTDGDYTNLSMSGIIDSWSSTTTNTIQLYRSFAKFQLAVNLTGSDITGRFQNLANISWCLANYSTTGDIYGTPSNDALSVSSRLSGSTFLYSSETGYQSDMSSKFIHAPLNSTSSLTKAAYCAPFLNATHPSIGNAYTTTISNTVWNVGRTCLILKVQGAGAHKLHEYGYYRLDLYNGTIPAFYNIQRNYCYKVTINKVRSFGYNTVQEAMTNPASNIEYSILVRDERMNCITSNGQYAILSDVDNAIVNNAGTYTIANIRYQLSPNYSFNPGLAGSLTDYSGNSFMNSIIAVDGSGNICSGVTVTSPTSLTTTSTPLVITTTSDFTGGYILLRFGNITHVITVYRSVTGNSGGGDQSGTSDGGEFGS